MDLLFFIVFCSLSKLAVDFQPAPILFNGCYVAVKSMCGKCVERDVWFNRQIEASVQISKLANQQTSKLADEEVSRMKNRVVLAGGNHS
jgi:hypothetical protein